MSNPRALHAAHRILLFCILFFAPVPAFAEAQLSISSPAADGIFLLQATNFDGVAGLEVAISYDPATLSNPHIELGSFVTGFMNAVNPGNPIKIALVGTHPLSGGGTIATITFDRTDSSLGKISSLSVNAVDLQARNVPVSEQIINHTQPASSGAANGEESTSPPSDPTPGSGRFIVGGTVTLPGGDHGASAETKLSATAPTPDKQPESAKPVRENPKPTPEPEEVETKEEPGPYPQKILSVLERFRLFKAEQTIAGMKGLFQQGSVTYFSQSPSIGISDGASPVKVLISKVTGRKTPNFTFNRAKFLSISQAEPGEWTLEVLPEKDAVEASVKMFLGGIQQEFPLTIAPKAEVAVTKASEPCEGDFLCFLKERGTPLAPKFDLNGDGKRDYLDDYIFTANFLVQMVEKEKKKSAQPQKQP